MLRRRFDSQGTAIQSAHPRRDGLIDVREASGTIIYGPYLDIPAGACTARILTHGGASGMARVDIATDFGQRTIASSSIDLATLNGQAIELTAVIQAPVSQFEVRLHAHDQVTIRIAGLEVDLEQPSRIAPPEPDRPVGTESRKSYAEKIENGFIARYLSGEDVLEVGYRGYVDGNVPIVPQAIGVDVDYPGYDGVNLPFADESFDAIYSSHCFEHITDYRAVLRDWYRLLKVGGYMIIVVPHQFLFEKRSRLPSRSNHDHKRFYTPDSLLAEIREALPENGYRIRHLADQDEGYDYARPPLDHAEGQFEIEAVVQKIRQPDWNLDDDSVRVYSAGEFLAREEFMFRGERPDPFSIEVDLSSSGHLFRGPHIILQTGGYRVTYYFQISGDIGQIARSDLRLDVAVNTRTITQQRLSADALRAGTASTYFQSKNPDDRFEFRIITSEPTEGRLIFKGVILDYAERARP